MSLTAIEHDLINRASTGDDDGVNQLIELARPKVQQYIYRMTLDYHVTQDVVQETLIDMAKCLGQLDSYDKFWPWLRRIAFNKLKTHQRKEFRQKSTIEKLFEGTKAVQSKGLSNLISEELSQSVMSSMRQLKSDHRRVLVLRCYEEMTYPEIADIMDRSEFGTRMLFVRAKNALKKKLAKNGLSKSALLTALIAFGSLTSNSEAAAVQISNASLNAGTFASLAAELASAATAVKVAAVLVAITSLSLIIPNNTTSIDTGSPSLSEVPSHMLCIMNDPQNFTEYWYSFPKGANGPLLSRFTARDSQTGHTIGQWFQTGSGNYYYDRSKNTVYMLNNNYYNSDFSVMSLPVDNQKMGSAIMNTYGSEPSFDNYIKYSGAGLFYLKGADQSGMPYSQAGRQLNIPKEEFFNLTWAKTARIVDLRDEVHKQGWADFTISGHINNKLVSGSGCLPLCMDALQLKQPWINLNLSGRSFYADNTDFPVGLPRPWLGLHTIDSLRRDIALNGYTPVSVKTSELYVIITIRAEKSLISYNVSLDKDLVDSIKITGPDGSETGHIQFNYVTDSVFASNQPSSSKLTSFIDVLRQQINAGITRE